MQVKNYFTAAIESLATDLHGLTRIGYTRLKEWGNFLPLHGEGRGEPLNFRLVQLRSPQVCPSQEHKSAKGDFLHTDGGDGNYTYLW